MLPKAHLTLHNEHYSFIFFLERILGAYINIDHILGYKMVSFSHKCQGTETTDYVLSSQYKSD